MAKVSVIIPVYNIEKYIKQCVESLLGQTLEDLEYIFVNDCTPDKSIDIINNILTKFPHRNQQVKIINMKQNSGQAAVRRTGIAAASGEYVIFCDGDDWVSLDMYKLMYETAIKEKADVVRCDFMRVSDSRNYRCLKVPLAAYGKKESLISYMLQFYDLSSTCDKLVKRNIYQAADFIYPIDDMCEDLLYVTQVFLRANKIVYIDKAMYFYRQNEASISHVTTLKHICRKADQISSNVRQVNDILEQYYGNRFSNKEIVVAKFMAKEAYRPLINDIKVYRLWKNCFKEINNTILLNPYVTWRKKVLYILCYVKIYSLLKYFIGNSKI